MVQVLKEMKTGKADVPSYVSLKIIASSKKYEFK